MASANHVILDVDPGHDDALAIMLAFGAPELDVGAVTTVAGNVPLEKTTHNALKMLTLLGRGDVPVGAGAEAPLSRPLTTGEHSHGESGLYGVDLPEPAFGADERDAVRLMADVVDGSTGPVTLIPTGPLTNVANFLMEHPDLKENIDRIVLMGGSIGLGNVTPAAEYNIYADPEAAQVVFECELPVTMVGLDVTEEATAGSEEIEHLRASSGRFGETAAQLAAYGRLHGTRTLPIHDAVAVATVLDPTVIETRRMRVDVEREGEITRGETVCDARGVTGKGPNAEVGVALNREKFFEMLLRSLGRRASCPPLGEWGVGSRE